MFGLRKNFRILVEKVNSLDSDNTEIKNKIERIETALHIQKLINTQDYYVNYPGKGNNIELLKLGYVCKGATADGKREVWVKEKKVSAPKKSKAKKKR